MKTGYKEMVLVEFAETQKSEVKLYVITESDYDVWLAGEPQMGYHVFNYMGIVHVQDDLPDPERDF